VNVITDGSGVLQNVIDYYEPDNPCQLINVVDSGTNGDQAFLAKDLANGNPILTMVDKDGQVRWSNAYANASAGLPASSVLYNSNTSKRFFILMSQPASPNLQLLISDIFENMPCAETPSTMIAENTTWPTRLDVVSLLNENPPIDFGFRPLDIAPTNYPLQQNIDCKYQYTCCSDIIDSNNITQVALCQGKSFMLPDSTIVTDSGRYYVSFTTPKGCDSTVFYQVTVSKNPSDLMLVSDTCLGAKDSIIVHATDSFAVYNWMSAATPSSYYTIYQPGTYWVSVNNICGMKTDSVHVYENCKFPIFMPNAFTPNGDGINDLFRVPQSNKDRMVSLRVYNRWGEMVFFTPNSSDGWNGTFNGQAQPAGTYVYFLIMNDLQGNQLTQKGTVVLVR
jgi:gliding motility-associated-like protein